MPEVRLVGPNGEQVGIVRIEDALRLALEADLDLVEVAPMAKPPVCKLMDFGKFKYEAALKERESRRNQTHTVIKEMKLRPKIDQPWFGSGKEPTGIKPGSGGDTGGGGRGLHAEQHYEYHRHLRPGDVLTATIKPGKKWEKEGRRSGKLIFLETIIEFRDQKGELVITARGVGVQTERAVEQEK